MAGPFPNVPIAAGVPAVARDPLAALIAVELLIADIAYFASQGIQQWGLFQNGVAVVLADNVVEMGYKQDNPISNFPQQGGQFQSYDKINLPFDIRLQFSTGGSITDRQLFLQSLLSIVSNTQLYDVLTPEVLYANVNVIHVEYDRHARDVGLVRVDVWVQQIQSTSGPAFQNVQSANSAAPQNVGNVAPGAPTAAQIKAAQGLAF